MTSSIEKSLLKVGNKSYQYFSLPNIAKEFNININNLPFSLRILLENLVRTYPDKKILKEHVLAIVESVKDS